MNGLCEIFVQNAAFVQSDIMIKLQVSVESYKI